MLVTLRGERDNLCTPKLEEKGGRSSKNMTEKRRVPINFSPNEHFNSHIKFLIFLTVNHTILIMLVHRI